MIVTIYKLSDLSLERREPEFRRLAEKAARLYSRNDVIPTLRDAVLMVLGSSKVAGSAVDIEEIEKLAALMR